MTILCYTINCSEDYFNSNPQYLLFKIAVAVHITEAICPLATFEHSKLRNIRRGLSSYGMDTERTIQLDTAIFDSQPALEEYLLKIRSRRENRRRNRLEFQRLHLAIQAVTAEIDAARQDDDIDINIDIVEELNLVLQEFQRRLAHLEYQPIVFQTPHTLPNIAPPLETASEAIQPQNIVTVIPPCTDPACATESRPPLPDPVATQDDQFIEPIFSESLIDDDYADETDNEESEARICTWLAELDALTALWNDLDREGLRQKDKTLNRPACFRLRSLACELAMIQADALDSGLASPIQPVVDELRNRMDLARTYAGDSYPILPFDERSWIDPNDRLASIDWKELAQQYTEVAAAQEAWDWYSCHREDMGNQIHLLNAIGARQQMLFRTLADFGGSDKLQMDLFGNLKAKAVTVGFLNSLHADTHWDTLLQLANGLPAQLDRAMQEVLGAREKREKEARKASAIQAVVQWEREFDLPNVPLLKKRESLLPLLDECTAAGIPASNVQVRSALLDSGPLLLADLPAYAKFLDAVVAERKRKGLDAIPSVDPESFDSEDDLSDAQISESLEGVRLLMKGQKILILGGSSRPQVAQKLKELLGSSSVDWPDSKKGDRMNKFRTMIIHSDVVVVAKNFASHEMTEKSRDWAKELGKKFVFLPSGYGVNQIINQMNLQLIQIENR